MQYDDKGIEHPMSYFLGNLISTRKTILLLRKRY